MGRFRVRSVIGAFGLLALATCSGCSGDGGVVTPPPVPVVTVVVTPPAADLLVGATTQLSATAKDASGAPLTGRVISWTSANQNVATVSTGGLVTAVGPGVVDVTATSEGKAGSASVTVSLANFQPSASTSLTGTQRFARVTVPAGVIVTATGALALSATDSLIIRGTITGDCVPVTLIGGTVVIEGDVRNACTADPAAADPPVLRIISGSSMELGAGVTESSGDIVVSNDTTLTDADFPIAPRLASHAFMNNAIIRGVCRTSGRTWRFPQRNAGASGQFGGDGRPGRTFRMDCAGDLILANGAVIQAQHGADGGQGIHTSVVAALSRGGNGGTGGKVRLRATGSIIVAGIGNEIRTGRGGAGGSSTSTGGPDPGPSTAASATATGGNGGPPGLAELFAGGSIMPAPGGGGLAIVAGDGGMGGQATATAQDGMDASARGAAPQNGGAAKAVGGEGSSTPDKKLVASGSVLLNVAVQGGNAGNGGSATASGGKGGNGNEAFPPGADGGRMEAVGGFAGDAFLRDGAGGDVGNGGNGGNGTLLNGLGGNGFSDCVPGNKKPGGPGGRGGPGFGQRGAAGSGKNNGSPGLLRAVNVGRGGNGGNGQGVGAAGLGGTKNLIQPDDVTGSFGPGDTGQGCPPISLAVIAGNYGQRATLVSMTGATCPPGAFADIDDPGPRAVTVASASAVTLPGVVGQVRIQSDFLVVGNMNDDGSWIGTGSGPLQVGSTTFSTLKTIKGTWQETAGGGVELNGEQEMRLFGGGLGGPCIVTWLPSIFTKKP